MISARAQALQPSSARSVLCVGAGSRGGERRRPSARSCVVRRSWPPGGAIARRQAPKCRRRCASLSARIGAGPATCCACRLRDRPSKRAKTAPSGDWSPRRDAPTSPAPSGGPPPPARGSAPQMRLRALSFGDRPRCQRRHGACGRYFASELAAGGASAKRPQNDAAAQGRVCGPRPKSAPAPTAQSAVPKSAPAPVLPRQLHPMRLHSATTRRAERKQAKTTGV